MPRIPIFPIRLEVEERERILAHAKSLGLSGSAWIRSTLRRALLEQQAELAALTPRKAKGKRKR